MSPAQVDETVFSKRMWIYRNLAEWRSLNASHVEREWVNGESFLYLGRNYQLELVDSQEVPLLLKNGRFCLLRRILGASEERSAQAAFQQFYCAKGERRIGKRVVYFSSKIGVTEGRVKVKELGYRWAQCLKNRDLHFHWKCMMAPPKVIDYIIVHELCHLHHRNHSVAFWNEVDKVMPDYRERKEWLDKQGAGLTL